MSVSVFVDKPWLTQFDGIQGLPPGMLGHFEAALLYFIARDDYKGHGDIVDAGAFLGASSWCLAKGLEENDRIRLKTGRMHAYDLFQVWSEPGGTDAEMASWLRQVYGVELAGYESTVGIYMNNVGPLGRHIQIHPGDVMNQQWSGRPIEIMFIDICKIKPIWLHLLKSFFPSLIPGISLVIHQDWHHPWLPYLHVAQEALSEYFELVAARANDTTVFRLIDRIPERVLNRVASYDFTADEEIDLLDRAIKRFAKHGEARFVKLAKAEMLRSQGRIDDASRTVHDVVVGHGENMTDVEQGWFGAHAAGVAERIERGFVDSPPSDFDRKYLESNADVRTAIADGHFKSGYHHWFRHGRWVNA